MVAKEEQDKSREEKAEEEKPVTTHVIIILDESGSMYIRRNVTIRGFNEQVHEILDTAEKNNATENTFITLTLFNTNVEITKFAEPISQLKELSLDEYKPNLLTAMLDAVGFTLTRIENEIEDSPDTHYLVIIISDGEENASKEFDYDAVGDMVRKRTKTGRWTFTYIGAEQDLTTVSNRMNIPQQNTLYLHIEDNFVLQKSYSRIAKAAKRHVTSVMTRSKIDDEFFDDDDDDGPPPGGLLH